MKKLLFATMILAVVGCSGADKEKKTNDVEPAEKPTRKIEPEETVAETPKRLKNRPMYDNSMDYGEPIVVEIKERNIVEVNLPCSGNIMVDNQIYKRSDLVRNHTGHSRLSHEIYKFLVDEELSEKRVKELVPHVQIGLSEGVVYLKVDSQDSPRIEVTPELYSDVYYEIEHAFDCYRDYVAMRLYGESYWDLPGKVQKYLRKCVPARIYDADNPYYKLVIVADDKEIKQPELTFTEEASDFDDFEFDMDVVEDEIKQPELIFTEYASDFDDFEFEMGEVEEAFVEDDEIFTILEDPATFKGGGLGDFRNWVMDRVSYPQIAIENGIQGNVIVEFVIDETGQLGRIKVLQSPDPVLSDATIAVLQKSPKWKPGKQRGKAVKMKFIMPVLFKLTK